MKETEIFSPSHQTFILINSALSKYLNSQNTVLFPFPDSGGGAIVSTNWRKLNQEGEK